MRLRPTRILAIVAVATLAFSSTAEAQIFGGRGMFGGPGLLPRLGLMPPVYGPGYGYNNASYGGCGECGMSYASTAYAPSTFSTASYGGDCGCAGISTASVTQISNPCAVAAAPAPIATACTYVRPVQQTVYREVPVTKYRTVQKAYKKPVYKTAYEERDVTVYRTVNEQKTVEVPFTTYQNVQSCQTAQVDRSRWQTTYVPTQKGACSCAYDSRPGLLGWMNRTGYEMRQAFTPKYVARRQYVPNVQTVAYAVNRRVPVQATRQVTYNVARVVPMTEKKRVAVLKLDYEDATYTAYEPYTETQTVAVGTTTQYAYVGGPAGTATALAPTPAPTTANRPVRSKTANGNKNDGRSASGNPFGQLNSYEPEEDEAPRYDRLQVRRDSKWAPRNSSTPVLRVAGWRAARPKLDGPSLSVAAND